LCSLPHRATCTSAHPYRPETPSPARTRPTARAHCPWMTLLNGSDRANRYQPLIPTHGIQHVRPKERGRYNRWPWYAAESWPGAVTQGVRFRRDRFV